MQEEILDYLDKFEDDTKERFIMIYKILCESTVETINERLWAKLPSYYVGDKFVRIIPFKDHLNLEAKTISLHMDELREYKITPKGMLQIFHNENIPYELLKVIFNECFENVTT